MDPAEGLARLERMGQRARARRAVAEAEERRRQEAADREWHERIRQEAVQRFVAGPPDACTFCYMFGEQYVGVGMRWDWWHVRTFRPVLRPWPEDDPEPVPTEHCMCHCHGPEGHPLPVIAYA